MEGKKKSNWSFSLLSAAYACSYEEDGGSGSKEVIQNLEVFTKNDFDAKHPAGSDLGDLMIFDNFEEEVILKEYLEREENIPVLYPSARLYLTQSPAVLSDFGVRF